MDERNAFGNNKFCILLLTYDNLYKIVRGHIRFYSYYWKSRQSLLHEDIIYEMMAENQLISMPFKMV